MCVGISVVLAMLTTAFARPAFADDGQKPGATAQAPTGTAPSFKPPTFADDTLTYVFGPDYHNPFVASTAQPDGADISRNAIEIKHIDAWKYGHNLIELQIKRSSTVEPASGGGDGALGLYGIFRFGLGINRLAGRPAIALGPLRDIDIEAGMNVESKNSAYAPQERTLYLGPNLQFRVGQGFFNLGLHLRKEWNHNGNVGKVERYRADFNISPVWRLPFRIGGAHLSFDGFADYNTAKGKDGAGHETKPEFITRPQLKLDLGPVVGGKARVAELGVGFEYWHNIFGKDADKVPGAKQFTPVVTLTVHLPLGGSGH